ncbi:hypothetical protein Ancab_001777 [Ancistrocladus abbreviatus]
MEEEDQTWYHGIQKEHKRKGYEKNWFVFKDTQKWFKEQEDNHFVIEKTISLRIEAKFNL